MSESATVAAEIAAGQSITVGAAAGLFPPMREGRPVHPNTVMRWVLSGVRSAGGRVVKLEAARVGCRWLTTRAAVERFVTAQQAAAPEPAKPAGVSPRDAAVERQLAELGV